MEVAVSYFWGDITLYTMNNKLVVILLLFAMLQTATHSVRAQDQPSPFQKGTSITEALQPLPFSAIKPTGWLREQLQGNLSGFTGHLDSLTPELIVKDDIYGANRLSRHVKSKNVGAISEDGDWQVQFLWWNSETQSNWWDGYIRTAVLLNNRKHLKKIKAYIVAKLATQDADGYLGIYDKDLRYRFDNENGELWAKATLLRGLLAWYSYTRDGEVLQAVVRAVNETMQGFPIGQSTPFLSKNPSTSGLSHGLMFTDVLEQLWHITGEAKYRDYAAFLYRDFSSHPLTEDAQYAKTVDPKLPLQGHGVHAYEHLRAIGAALYATGNPSLKMALDGYLRKVEANTLPSGAPLGDEFIGGRTADATSTGYEYCSLHELLDSYASLYAKSGSAEYGSRIERIFFNAAQGARHPHQSAICYLKTDNSYQLTGGKNGDTTDKFQTRYRYSPTHKEAAVCCVPNAGRIGPYYVQNMWMKDNDGLVATLLGPCTVATEVKGSQVVVVEETSYPYGLTINLKVKVDRPTDFVLKIRKPEWAKGYSVDRGNYSDPFTEEKDGYIEIRKTWRGTKKVSVKLLAEVELRTDAKGERYFTYGPLVLARPIASTETVTKQLPVKRFSERVYTPTEPVKYQFVEGASGNVKQEGAALRFRVTLFNPAKNTNQEVTLVPMGETILRQVTFANK